MGILKDQLTQSRLGKKGATPPTREGANPNSQVHAQEARPTVMKAAHSEYDLDGKKPARGTYRDNAPEGASF
jgi:hypothetical protein